ncbi:glutathione S-transferase family protein [Caulobacter endophyticus]|uniref:Glutathione S-transferase family protein n=1 Tax=Caulobacter endophyticus TaxID=2172652 RepID=A0A2T9K9Y8_9CAUL|nr:glutathione S-transferase family protein [Caulobacter endophyticus]PVM92788.1 glutathione S-transferase family protein [Caulobacter endophyticus]
MTLRIFGDGKSGNCLKVKWTAQRLNLPFEWIEIDILKGESRTSDFLTLNPAGQVPAVLLEDGRALAQSNAIMLHLAEGSVLIPSDPYLRARMYEWLFWEQYSHEPYVAVARFQVAYMGKAVESLDGKLVERGHAALARLENGLSESGFLVGDRLTLADIALVAYTRVAHEGGFDLARYPAVKAWVGRVETALGID